MGCKPAVTIEAGEDRSIAKVFVARPAIGTVTAGAPQPWNSNAIPDTDIVDFAAGRDDFSNHLMAGNDRQRPLKISVDNVKVGPANAACAHLEDDVVTARSRKWTARRLQRLTAVIELHDGHHHSTHVRPARNHASDPPLYRCCRLLILRKQANRAVLHGRGRAGNRGRTCAGIQHA